MTFDLENCRYMKRPFGWRCVALDDQGNLVGPEYGGDETLIDEVLLLRAELVIEREKYAALRRRAALGTNASAEERRLAELLFLAIIEIDALRFRLALDGDDK